MGRKQCPLMCLLSHTMDNASRRTGTMDGLLLIGERAGEVARREVAQFGCCLLEAWLDEGTLFVFRKWPPSWSDEREIGW